MHRGDSGVVALIELDPIRSYGLVLAACAAGPSSGGTPAAPITILVNERASDLARLAQDLGPAVHIAEIDGSTVTPAVAAAPIDVPTTELQTEFRELFDHAGLHTVDEFAAITAEFRGLEVARVTGVNDTQRVDVGIGAYDQGAFAMMNPEFNAKESLAYVVRQAGEHRVRGAEPHPMNRLVRERWLRAEALVDPTLVGCVSIEAVAPARPRGGLHEMAPSFAIGHSVGGATTLLAFSVGIDLALVPDAVEVASRFAIESVAFVVPEQDQHRVTLDAAGQMRWPATFLIPDLPWAAPAGSTPAPSRLRR